MRKFTNNIIVTILVVIMFYILLNSSIVLSTVNDTINIFKKNIFPSLFTFFILSELLINYGFIDIISKIFSPITTKLFKVNSKASFIFFMSMISGFPSNAKYTKDLYLKGEINCTEASKILMFTHFSNPLFIIGTISISFLSNKKVGLLILIIHYFTNIIIGILFRNFLVSNNNSSINNNETLPFSKVLSKSIINSINTLMLILGTMITFLILTNIVTDIFNFNPLIKTILSGFLEMTGGISNTSILDLSLKNKSIIIGMILSFGGICVHMQVKSIISDTPILYQPFLIARLLHSSITGILIYLLFDFFI